MLKFITKRLALKTSLALTAVAVPLMAATGYAVVRVEDQAVERLILQKGRVAALAGASACVAILRNGLRDRSVLGPDGSLMPPLTLEDLIQPKYEQFQFPGISDNVDRFRTKYDRYGLSHGIQEVEDTILQDQDIVYASMIDHDGFVGVPHAKHAEAPNGNPEHDRKNRAYRKYEGEPRNAARFVALRGGETTWTQEYHRSPGEEIWDIVAPIEIEGQHFGGFRVGVIRQQIAAHAWELGFKLVAAFSILIGVLALITMIIIQWWMKPLTRLSETAEEMSTDTNGAVLAQPIIPSSNDEVGRMARALNRLRQSLKGAMDLLEEK